MIIEQMFQEDINRKINGVVKVDQNAKDVLVQELNEYVITRELKKHFTTFFNNYLESFNEKTADIGVWISGFFGSGKSHFLKMLSYLLENEEIDGVKSVERFRKKFDEDPLTFKLIDDATRNQTDTILFNIDIEKQFLSKNKFKEFKFIKNYSENDLFIFHFLIFIFNNGYSFFTIMQNKVSFIIKINHIENIKYEINKVKIEKISNVFKYDYTHNKINIIQDNIKK